MPPSDISPDVEQFASTQVAVVDQVGALVVASYADAEAANELLTRMRAAAKALEEKRVSLKAPALETCRRIDAFFNGTIERLTEGTKAVKAKINTFLEGEAKRKAEEDRRIREEQERARRQLEAEARKKEEAAAAERAKAKAQAEAEQRAREEAERRHQEAVTAGDQKAAVKAAGEIATLETRAQATLETGEAKAAALDATAASTRELASSIATPSGPAPVAKPKGFSVRTVYGCEVVNKMALLKAIVEGKAPHTLVVPDDSALRRKAQAEKEAFDVPGCRLTTRQA